MDVISQFPGRRFLLFGDSGQMDAEAYGEVVRDVQGGEGKPWPEDRIIGIFIRKVAGENVPLESKLNSPSRFQAAFTGLDSRKWRVFADPIELIGLDLPAGQVWREDEVNSFATADVIPDGPKEQKETEDAVNDLLDDAHHVAAVGEVLMGKEMATKVAAGVAGAAATMERRHEEGHRSVESPEEEDGEVVQPPTPPMMTPTEDGFALVNSESISPTHNAPEAPITQTMSTNQSSSPDDEHATQEREVLLASAMKEPTPVVKETHDPSDPQERQEECTGAQDESIQIEKERSLMIEEEEEKIMTTMKSTEKDMVPEELKDEEVGEKMEEAINEDTMITDQETSVQDRCLDSEKEQDEVMDLKVDSVHVPVEEVENAFPREEKTVEEVHMDKEVSAEEACSSSQIEPVAEETSKVTQEADALDTEKIQLHPDTQVISAPALTESNELVQGFTERHLESTTPLPSVPIMPQETNEADVSKDPKERKETLLDGEMVKAEEKNGVETKAEACEEEMRNEAGEEKVKTEVISSIPMESNIDQEVLVVEEQLKVDAGDESDGEDIKLEQASNFMGKEQAQVEDEEMVTVEEKEGENEGDKQALGEVAAGDDLKKELMPSSEGEDTLIKVESKALGATEDVLEKEEDQESGKSTKVDDEEVAKMDNTESVSDAMVEGTSGNVEPPHDSAQMPESNIRSMNSEPCPEMLDQALTVSLTENEQEGNLS